MMRLKRSIFCTSLLFSQISCYSLNSGIELDLERAPANDVLVGSLSGKVLDNYNKPIEGATITVSEDRRVVFISRTDQFGNYLITDLISRDYSVNASADGYRGDTYMVRVIEGVDIEYTFKLKMEKDPAETGSLVLDR